uniref:F-box domain-containing protein n=1 Tax=Strongyloides papillosus TaxID=174720 RepID=A0A0N5BSI4_STREA
MDFISDGKITEEQNNIFVLPDVLLVRILSELSWKDILKIKLVSRSFYNFVHENYHQLNRREVSDVEIVYVEDSEGFPFSVDFIFARIGSYKSTNGWDGKAPEFESGEELSRFLKMFDMRNLKLLDLQVYGNLAIFGIINSSFQKGTKIDDLNITKLSEEDFTSFRMFLDKLLLVHDLSIRHVCCHSTEAKDVNPLSFLPFFNITKGFSIYECNETRILSTDMISNFLRKNPSVERLTIGSGNSEFIRSLFKEHFTLEQPHKMENTLSYSEISIDINFFGSEYKQLSRFLMSDLCEPENVQEVISIQNFPERSEVESVINCKHCPKNKHKIKIHATLEDDDNSCQRFESLF